MRTLRVPESSKRILALQERYGENRDPWIWAPPARREKETHPEGIKTRSDNGYNHLKGRVTGAEGTTPTLLEDPAVPSFLPRRENRGRQAGLQ